MNEEEGARFSEFLKELDSESDRGLALVGAALIDEKLDQALRAFLRQGKSATELLDDGKPLATFSGRTHLAHALGLITDDEHREITFIRKIRNEFAHSSEPISFSTARIQGLCSTLRARPPSGANGLKGHRSWYFQAVVWAVVRLWYRADYVRAERREERHWIPPESGQWIPVTEKSILDYVGKDVILLERADSAGVAKVVVTTEQPKRD